MNDGRLSAYLGHLRQAASDACVYVEGFSKDDFLADKRTQQAVILNLLIIGETATKLLSDHPAFTDKHQDIPWRGMKGMRNRIAHGYFGIDLDVVWNTVKTALPQLLVQLSTIRIAEDGASPASPAT